MDIKRLPFTKLSGAGNDFLLIDNREMILTENVPAFVQAVCRRGMSVGADGVILVEPSNKAHFRMRYFNSDGSEGETCGNGSRCVSRFAYIKGIAPASMKFETLAGMYEAQVLEDNRVRVQVSNPKDLRINLTADTQKGPLTVHFINTGVPHAVIVLDTLDELMKFDVFNIGRELRHHSLFAPAGTNVNMVVATGEHTARIRTYERGVENETLACGTGSIASAMILEILGKIQNPVQMTTQGGPVLGIDFNRNNNDINQVFLEGEARVVFEGELTPEAFQ